MSKYRLISSDLDGTLLNSAMTVSQENKDAIRKLSEKGIYFVPNSGRTLGEISNEVKNDPFIRYVIYSDGAVIYDKLTKKRYTAYFPCDLYLQILDILRQYDGFIILHHAGRSYVDAERFYRDTLAHYHIDIYWEQMFRASDSAYVQAFDDFCRTTVEENETVVVFFHSPQEREDCIAALRQLPVQAVSTAPDNLEIFSAEAGKGTALLRLAKLLHIDRNDTIALGDTMNDADMLHAAGLGVAMQNAWESLKAVADQTLPISNDEHVAKYILEHYTTV